MGNYLLASSIATATATVIPTMGGAGTDETHHLFALGVLKGLQSGETSLKVLLYMSFEKIKRT